MIARKMAVAFGRGCGFASGRLLGGNWTPDGILQLEGEAIEDDGLSLEVSDVELEAAAGETTHPAMTFPAAPTVSVLVLRCRNDRVA